MEILEESIRDNIQENITYFNNILNQKNNFDIVFRQLKIGGKKVGLFFVDGFLQDDIMQKLIQFFYSIREEDMPKTPEDMAWEYIPYGEVSLGSQWKDILYQLLSGISVMFVEGYDKCIFIDCRTYPARNVNEPEKDKVLRGSKDGFVETLVFNTALIRRRIRTPEFIVKMKNVGRSSKTDIAICYMENRVDRKLLDKIEKRLDEIQVDALTLNQESLIECLYPYSWYNPFPKFKYSERPDTAAAQILEGNIVLLVDNSPSCIILPDSVFDIMEEADDFYFPPITGTYLRMCRYMIGIVTLIWTPLSLLFVHHPDWLPSVFEFTVIKDDVNIPVIFQFLLLEIAIDGLKLAAVNTPSMLSTPLSIVAALALGEYSVNSGWFNEECVLYMAFVAVANYTQQNYELGYALKFLRIILLILTGIFDIYGFLVGIVLILVMLVSNKTISGKGYFYPLIPFNFKALIGRMKRKRIGYEIHQE